MKELHLFDSPLWYPFKALGITSPLAAINSDTIIYTWIALVIIALLACLGRIILWYPDSLAGFAVKSFFKGFVDLIDQSIPNQGLYYTPFISALFVFILICNILILLPFMEEPTKDLNTTLACALLAFFYIQKELIRVHGLKNYAKEFFKTPLALTAPSTNPLIAYPILLIKIVLNTVAAAALFPIELLSKLATVMSLSFRLFGNIFAGSLIGQLWHNAISGSIIYQLLGIFTGLNFIILGFFGLFEGIVQALVFAILTLTYLALGLASQEDSHA